APNPQSPPRGAYLLSRGAQAGSRPGTASCPHGVDPPPRGKAGGCLVLAQAGRRARTRGAELLGITGRASRRARGICRGYRLLATRAGTLRRGLCKPARGPGMVVTRRRQVV